MRRITRFVRVGVVVVALVVAAAAPAGAGQQVERPFKGFDAGTSAVEPIEECEFLSETVIECDITTEGTGNATHLGKTSTVSTEGGKITLDLLSSCVLLDGETLGLVFAASGPFVVTAANGDELHGTYANTGCAGPPGTEEIGTAINGTQTYAGGTGRFEGASGQTVTSGAGFGAEFVLEYVGTITY